MEFDAERSRAILERGLAAANSSAISPVVTVVAALAASAVIVVVVVLWTRRGPRSNEAGATTGTTAGATMPAIRRVGDEPSQIGPYRLHTHLGGGGMGRVFLGSSPGGLTVAVKAVHPDLADDPAFRRRFAAEVEAARRVGGFYTAQVVDADPDGDPPWLATAYIPGPSCTRRCATTVRCRPLRWPRSARAWPKA